MAIDEIEVPGMSFSLRLFSFKTDSIRNLFEKIQSEGDQFSTDPEVAGFHDLDANEKMIRGFFSVVVPFEVEHLVDGIQTKTLFKRIDTCEFFALENRLFITGKTSPQSILKHALTRLSRYVVLPMKFEFRELNKFQERLSLLKGIAVTNPKDMDVRKVKMSGRIEDYTRFNIMNRRDHGIEAVSGLVDSPLGPITVTVNQKGGLRLNVRRGFVLTIEVLEWILAMIREEEWKGKTNEG